MPLQRSTEHKIGIVGTINRDTIYQPDGGQVESWGGLLYSLKFLCKSGDARIVPVVNIGRDSYRSIMEILGRFQNIDLAQIKKVTDKNNHCFLHYHSQSHKCEILKGGVPPLTFVRMKPLLDCNLVLINFISGPDIKLVALETFRRHFRGMIYMDIHSLTLGRKKVKDGYRRFLRRPRQWKRYVSCADILQVNECEFELLSGKNFSRRTATAFVEDQLKGLKCLAITRGAEGCIIVYRKGEKLLCRNIPPVKVSRVHDTTGCGDIFGSGFVTEFLRSGSFIKAAEKGNRLAAARCREKKEMF